MSHKITCLIFLISVPLEIFIVILIYLQPACQFSSSNYGSYQSATFSQNFCWPWYLHWQCVTDLSGLSTYGLNGQLMGDEHPAYAPDGARPGLPFLRLFGHKGNYTVLQKTPPTFSTVTCKPIVRFW